ncbi:MAG: apolipoprotein N-acyltransferase [Ignavibacteriae bacterium]|nr:apolipoprotein N-acyltransferase [Ignavibacteriota bacterium]
MNITRRSRISLAVLSGTLLGLAFPPSPLYSAAYVALVPFLFLMERLENYKQVVWYSYLMTFVFHLFSLYWIGGFTHGRDPYLMASGAAVIILHPLFYWIIFIPYFFIRKHGGVLIGLFSFPFLWISFDYLHSLSEVSFPWVSLGNSQAYDLYRIQIAEYTSLHGPAFVVLLFNVLAFILLIQLASKSWKFSSRESVLTFFVLLLVYLLPLFYGRMVVSNREIPSNEERINVGIVQPDIDPWKKWGEGVTSRWEYYQSQVKLLQEKSAELINNDAELIVWPETAIPFEILSPRYQSNRSELLQYIDTLGVAIFTGLPAAEVFDSTNAPVTAIRVRNSSVFVDYYNSATLLAPDSVGPVYKKVVLVPFAERVPYAERLSFLIEPLKWSVGISGWGKGEEQIVYLATTKSGTQLKFSGMICYESVYPDYVRGFVDRGAQFLVVITNDSWWGNTSGVYQHIAYASFRAIENRRWVVQCANGGISAFVDDLGKIHLSTEMYTPAAVVSSVMPLKEMTFYAKHGDVFAQVCLYCSLLLLIIALWKKMTPRTEVSTE